MKNRVVIALMDALRAGGESAPVAYERVLQILAWAALAERHEIDRSLSLDNALGAEDGQLGEMIAALAQHGRVSTLAFATLRAASRDSFVSLRAGIAQCLRMRAQGMLSGLSAADLAAPVVGREFDLSLPPELAELLIGLVPDLGASIYVGWDAAGQLTARALKTGARVHCDVTLNASICSLIGLIVGGPLSVEAADPIRAPGAVEHGKLTKFRSAVAFPPIGMRYDLDTAERDLFGRFPEKTTLSSVLSVRHLMAVAQSHVMICVPNGFLFGANADRELRRSLVEQGQVRAVVALPPGLLTTANIAISMLVLSPPGGERTVRVVNADDDRFRTMLSKTRSELKDIRSIIETVNGEADGQVSRDIDADEIASNDYQLQVARYLIPDEQKRIRGRLVGVASVPLGEQVEILRPPVIKSKGDVSAALREVGVGDLPAYGYIGEPQRQIDVDQEMARKLNRFRLRPLDIVLAIKGSVGKVGLVPPSVRESDVPWIAGQSSVALRVHSPAVEPKALFMLLRSELGQALIKSIVSAGTIPFIQTRELESLAIPLPALTEQTAAAEILDKEALIQQDIGRLHSELAKLSASLWPV